MPTARMVINGARHAGAPSHVEGGVAWEFSYSRANGSDFQTPGAGAHPVVVNGQSFSGSQPIRHDFSISWYEVAFRGRGFPEDGRFGIEGLAGVAFPRVALRSSTPTQQASETYGGMGPVLGLGALWRFTPATRLEARVARYWSIWYRRTDSLLAEVSLAHALGRNVVVRAGYAQRSLEIDRETHEFQSSVDLRVAGPAIGLEVLF